MFKKSILAILLSSFFLLAPVSMATTVLSDDFNDNLKGDMWELFCVDEPNLWLEETSQHLELRATGEAPDIGAAYFSEGWQLIPSQDFSLKIDFSHNLETFGWSDLMVVLSNSNDIPGTHLQFSACSYENNKNFYFELRENDTLINEAWFARDPNSGSLYVSYNYNLDELYLSNTGYGSSDALRTISGLIRGSWQGKPIKIAIGGGSAEFIGNGELFLDNFIIEGDISQCTYNLAGDYNNDCKLDMLDLAEFASNWLIDCSSNPDISSCIFDPKWQTEPPMFTARDQFAGGVINGKIYVFGGNGNPNSVNLKSTEVFDPNASEPIDAWVQLADNNHNDDEGVEEITGAVANNKLYVFGAHGANFNEKYDPETGLWTTLAQKPTSVSGAPSAIYDGKIYLFGGDYYHEVDPPNICDVVECYDVAGNSWQYVTNMPKLLIGPALAVIGNKAYLIGGFDPNTNEMSTDILTYDFDTGVWQPNILNAMPNDRARVFAYSSAAPVVGSEIYLIGGFEGNREYHFVSKKVDIYDTATDSWRKVKDLPLPIGSHLSVIAGSKVYILGGFNNEDYYNRSKHEVISGNIY